MTTTLILCALLASGLALALSVSTVSAGPFKLWPKGCSPNSTNALELDLSPTPNIHTPTPEGRTVRPCVAIGSKGSDRQ
jgi:hypothetical protein